MVPNAPSREVPCPFCQADGVPFPQGNGRGGKCDPFCQGGYEESEAPEVNLSNANAAGILALLGFQGEDLGCGSAPATLIRHKILFALNRDRSHLVSEATFTPGGTRTIIGVNEDGLPAIQRMGPSVIDCGNTDEQTLHRLQSLQRLALWAQDNNLPTISWG